MPHNSQMSGMRVAVVGAGIAGASAARHLAERGHEVTVFEQFEPGHTKGSSHGQSRIVRKAYPDAFYTAIMQEAYPMWAELDAHSDLRLLHECGLLYFGNQADPSLLAVVEALKALDVPHEVLDPLASAQKLPGLILTEDEIGIFTPEAGWVNAGKSVQTSLALAEAVGAWIVRQKVTSLEKLEKTFDRVVLCAGPWVGKFVKLDVAVTVQTLAYVKGKHEGPVWIEEGPRYAYGFPSEPGRAAWKLGAHNLRIPWDPDDPDRPESQETLDGIEAFAERRFGEVRSPLEPEEPLVTDVITCLYTNTPDEDFRFGRLSEKTVYASACSGHGFKFGPWVGRFLADVVEERQDIGRYKRFYCEAERVG